MQVKGDSSLNKLILLFVFDKMEVPLSENTVLDMCCSSNNWLAYMDCQPILKQLLDCGWIYNIGDSEEPLYTFAFYQKQPHPLQKKTGMRCRLFYE